MTLEEFGELTPAMFWALLERREVAFRYQCLSAGLIAATLINLKRRPEDPPVSPYIFAGVEQSDRDAAKQNIVSLFAMVGSGPPEQFITMRRRAIEGLKRDGFDDAEELFSEVFTAWKETVTSNGTDSSRNITG